MINLTAKTVVGLALATAACALAAKKTETREEYGVGINLSFDYGTISIQYPNRTIVDVATVNGNPAYQHLMLDNIPKGMNEHDFQDDMSEEELLFNQDEDSLIERIRRVWRPTRKVDAIQGMYRALKTAGETYLDTQIKQAVITVPYDMTDGFHDHLEASAAAASIEAWMFPDHPAAQVAAFAYGLGRGRRGPGSETVTLAIDYNEACLSAVLTHESSGFSERYNTVYNTTLGLRHDPTFHQLADAMEQIIDAVPEGNCPLISLALSGAAADDKTFRAALMVVLRKYYYYCRSSAGEDPPDMDVSPLYAASRGGAELCAQRMNGGMAGQLDL